MAARDPAMTTLSAASLLAALQEGDEVRNVEVSEDLILRGIADGDYVRVPIRISDCRLAGVDLSCLQFERAVRFERCTVGSLMGMASYFLSGLTVEHCIFRSVSDFSCGGHNRGGSLIAFSDTVFTGFADFTDCWFEGPLALRRCRFDQGSNLLGNRGRPYEVTFDFAPVFDANEGHLDLDSK